VVASKLFREHLGIEILEVSRGHARTRVRVREEFSNIHGYAHGGLIFSLADEAFALACNEDSSPAVAVSINMDYLKPVSVGDILTAEAKEVRRGRTMGFYDVFVVDEAARLVAKMRGISYSRAERDPQNRE